MREAVAKIVRRITTDPDIAIVTSAFDFAEGLSLFEARLDKGYSMTDCTSMNTMRGIRATEVLTHDHHFAREGFTVLL